MRLKDKAVVVTGGGSGIGRAMANLYAAEGARVLVADIAGDSVEETLAEIKKAGGVAAGFVGDVSKDADVCKMIDTAVSTFDRLDVLCNNAGVLDRLTPAADVTDALWEKVLGVNLDAVFFACRKAIPIMIERGGGAILNTASAAGLGGGRGGAAYTASKWGVVGLTKSIAWYYGDKKIRCNAICPGGVETPLVSRESFHQGGFDKMQPSFAYMRRYGKPQEVAQAALFLVSDESRFVNGDVMIIDGGWTLT